MSLTLLTPPPEPVSIERRMHLGPSGSAAAVLRPTLREMSAELARHAARQFNTSSAPEVRVTGEATIEDAEGVISVSIAVVRRRA